MVYAPVRSIIPSLKLGGLPFHTGAQTTLYLSLIFGMIIDVGPKFHSAPSPPLVKTKKSYVKVLH